MKVALVGATGMVGGVMLKVLEEQAFPVTELIPVASERSKGKKIQFNTSEYVLVTIDEALVQKPDLAIFSAGGNISKEWAPRFAEKGCVVIDNSSAWRMDPNKPLVVPEVNANVLGPEDKIIANPNCSTIQLVMVLYPLHKKYNLKRVVISTYQSITGTGKQAVDQMEAERKGGGAKNPAYPHAIDLNCLPHCDVFEDNAYTKEEMKLVNEPKKIMQLPEIKITATAVRVPVVGGHSESVNIEFQNDFDIVEVKEVLNSMPGVVVLDDPYSNTYPMPLTSQNRDEVFVGRIRRDESQANTLNCWIVADNLRKGAATNAVQVATYLHEKDWL
jgi:aspartate-semialdehyde dehydrogenase